VFTATVLTIRSGDAAGDRQHVAAAVAELLRGALQITGVTGIDCHGGTPRDQFLRGGTADPA
jgi:hypothetical protein